MSEKDKVDKSKGKQLSRREFLKDAGLVAGGAAVGSMAILSACGTQPATTVTVEKVVEVVKLVSVPKSAYIQWDADNCALCSACVLVCAVAHGGLVAPQLSAIRWVEHDYYSGLPHRQPLFCQQCSQPECYYACPLKDKALCIDAKTGARYINKEYCNGCGICELACPFEIPSSLSE